MIYIFIIYSNITASNNNSRCQEKTKLINANNINLYREPRFNGPNSPLIYRPTQQFIILCTSAGAEVPEVNHPNFYKVANYLNNLKIEYPSLDEEPLFEAVLRETDWNLIMK